MASVKIDSNNFNKYVLETDKTVLLDFWATWCGPCKMIAPIIEDISEEYQDITVGKVNVDEEPLLAAKFGIESIPTLCVIKNREIVGRLVGYRPKNEIIDLLK